MQGEPTQDLPVDVRLYGHVVQFKVDVTGRIKATCRAFPEMLVRQDDLQGAMREARKEVTRLTAARIAERS